MTKFFGINIRQGLWDFAQVTYEFSYRYLGAVNLRFFPSLVESKCSTGEHLLQFYYFMIPH